ncbi:Ig-like domain-containing protein [Myxococcota bacterium]
MAKHGWIGCCCLVCGCGVASVDVIEKAVPEVTAVEPANGSREVPRDVEIEVSFSEAIQKSTLDAGVRLANAASDTDVSCVSTYDPDTFALRLAPSEPLVPHQGYLIELTTAIKDLEGNPLGNEVVTTFWTIDDVAPGAPGTPDDGGDATPDPAVTFSWGAATDQGSGVASYVLEVGTLPEASDVFSGDVGSALSHVVTGTSGQTLYARVAAKDEAGNRGDWSPSSDGILIDLAAPSAPGTPQDSGEFAVDTQVSFTWTAPNDLDGQVVSYDLQVGTSPDDSDLFEGNVGDTLEHAVSGSHNQTLYARVAAVNQSGVRGPWSGSSDGILIDTSEPTAPSAPTDPGATSHTATIPFSWTAAQDPESGVVSYVLQVGTSWDNLIFDDDVGDVLSAEVTGSVGDTLYARVAANNGAGAPGAWSGISDGITIIEDPVCSDDGQACLLDDACCGICDYVEAVCISPDWLDCEAPVHPVEPSDTIDTTPGGMLRYLWDQGYQGDIYDGHIHVFATGETHARSRADGDLQVLRPITIQEHFDLHKFFTEENLNIRGGSNLALANFGGLGDPSSTFQYGGDTYPVVYWPAEAGTPPLDDNMAAFAGNVLSAFSLYTKLASYEPSADAYHYFAFTGPDWAAIRAGILEGSITSIEGVKARLAEQLERFRDLGFDGLKFKQEWFPDTPPGVMRDLVLLETLPDVGDEPWEIDSEMFNGPGGILDTAAQLGMPIVMHAGDATARAEEFWQPNGIWATVLEAHPGLKLQIAHGFAVAWAHKDAPHVDHAEKCNQRVQWMLELFERFDGQDGRAMLSIDLVWHFMMWWKEHNDLFQRGIATDFDYRDILINESRHFLLGMDPVNRAASDFQSDGCGLNGRMERNYITYRVTMEGPYDSDSPSIRFLDLLDEEDTLTNIYHDNLFRHVSVDPDDAYQVGLAGLDTHNVRHIDCAAGIAYLEELRDSIRTDYRNTTPETDPGVLLAQQTIDDFAAKCADFGL